MKRSTIRGCWMRLCLLLAVVMAAASPGWAQSAVGIESPRQGSVVAGALPRPHGSAGSSSGLSGVALVLQRAAGGGWLSWNGGAWSSKTSFVDAPFSASTHGWQWPGDVALPAGPALSGGSYRLWAMARSANGSVLGRAASTWEVRNGAGSSPIALDDTSPPPNDNFANAIEAFVRFVPDPRGGSGMVYYCGLDGSTAYATLEPGDPVPSPDVWYKWTVPQDGQVTWSLSGINGTSPDLRVYTGSGLGNLTPIPGNYIHVVAGTTYYLALSSGNFGFGFFLNPSPPNDNFARAIDVSAAPYNAYGGTVTGADDYDTTEPGDPFGSPDVWYRWTAPASGKADFGGTTPGGYGYFHTDVYRGTGLGSLVSVTSGPSNGVSFQAEAGTTYYVAVNAEGRGYDFGWSLVAAPPNDLPSNAALITGAAGSVSGTTVGASGEGPDGAASSGKNVWYRWTAPGSGIVAFDTKGSAFDTFLRVYTLHAGTASTYDLVGEDDNSGANAQALLTFNVQSGASYLISVGSLYSETGAIGLNWRSNTLSGLTNTVPGTSDPWLAGMPNGTGASNGDVAPTHSAVLMKGTVLKPGNALSFAAVGGVSSAAGYPLHPADGDSNSVIAHDAGAQNGISDVKAPFDSLLGVFLGPARPDASPAPDALDFSSAQSQSRLSLAPALKQVFFIGDGKARSGVVQKFTVPAGATRLFLGTMDSTGWYNNQGFFTVQVTDAGAPPADVGGRVLDKAGKGIAGATVFLIPGVAVNPIVVPQEDGPPRHVLTSADGSYSFSQVANGPSVLVAVKSGVAFSPLGYTFAKAPTDAPRTGRDFHASTLDSTGPEVTIGSVTRSVVNGMDVPKGATGTVRDFNAAQGQAPAGVLGVVYALQKLKDDAASLKLTPGNRGVASIFSKKARGFVPYVPGPPLNNDKTFIIGASNFDWSTHFTPDVQKALASPGTCRLLVFAVDRAFNLSRNPSTSTSPDSPAGASYTLAHFIVRPAHLAVTRTLPLSAPNGSLITYLISVSNTGDLPLENVSVIQTLNTQKTTLQGGTISPAPSAINAFGVTWKFATLSAHQTEILTIKVKANEGNPFGSNIKAGQLDVSSNGGVARFDHDQVNIESSTWLIGGFLNGLRGVGDAIGRGLNHVFGSSQRDQLAEADLNSVKAGTGVTRVAGADALRFGNGVTLVATGGGNLVASGGGNLISIAGIKGASILSELSSDPASLLSSTSSFASALLGANLVAQGGGNLVASGGGNLKLGDIALFVDNTSGLLADKGLKLISQDGGGLFDTRLVSQDGGGLLSQDGGGLVNLGGAELLAGRGNNVISNDGGSLVGIGKLSLISQDGGG